MKTKPEAIALIESALAAGPPDGPWIAAGPSFGAALPVYLHEVVVDREGDDDDTYSVCRCPTGLDDDPESGVAMDYIAACNPANMLEVLAHIAAQDAEIARLREAGSQLSNCAFNLSQTAGKVLSNLSANTLKLAYKNWDAVLTTKGTT